MPNFLCRVVANNEQKKKIFSRCRNFLCCEVTVVFVHLINVFCLSFFYRRIPTYNTITTILFSKIMRYLYQRTVHLQNKYIRLVTYLLVKFFANETDQFYIFQKRKVITCNGIFLTRTFFLVLVVFNSSLFKFFTFTQNSYCKRVLC